MPQSFNSSRSVVQRHVLRRFTLRFCSLWCEGFAPHTANPRFAIWQCVPLHLCTTEEEAAVSCAAMRCPAVIMVRHGVSTCVTHGEVELVMHPACIAYVNVWVLLSWCKGTDGSVPPGGLAVCGVKASHHTPQTFASKCGGV